MDDAVILGDQHSRLMAKMMELVQQRQQVIAHNLSNANTPGYIRRDVDFSEQLARLVRQGDSADIEGLEAQVIEDRDLPARLDGNNVQVPREMNEMMQNGLMYELLAKAFSTRTSILKMAMQGAQSR